MSDDELLRGYRPAGPPPGLRARILTASARPTFRDWLPAIAAAALVALFGALSQRVHADIDATLTVPDDLRLVEQWLPDDVRGLR